MSAWIERRRALTILFKPRKNKDVYKISSSVEYCIRSKNMDTSLFTNVVNYKLAIALFIEQQKRRSK